MVAPRDALGRFTMTPLEPRDREYLEKRLPVGDHYLTLISADVRATRRGTSVLEAMFEDDTTSTRWAWAWFVGAAGWAGVYETDRARAFFIALAEADGISPSNAYSLKSAAAEVLNITWRDRHIALELARSTARAEMLERANVQVETYARHVVDDRQFGQRVRAVVTKLDRKNPQTGKYYTSAKWYGLPHPVESPAARALRAMRLRDYGTVPIVEFVVLEKRALDCDDAVTAAAWMRVAQAAYTRAAPE
jgi:hypothetical protein